MTATYTSDLKYTIRDRIRYRLGDTDTTNALVTDAEIAAALDLESQVETDALVFLADGLIARYGREPIKITQDGQTLDFTGRLAMWQGLLDRFERLATTIVTTGIRVRRLNRPANIETATEYSGSETARTTIYGPQGEDNGVLEGQV